MNSSSVPPIIDLRTTKTRSCLRKQSAFQLFLTLGRLPARQLALSSALRTLLPSAVVPLATIAFELFDRFTELFKNLNLTVIALPQLPSQLHHFEQSRCGARSGTQLAFTTVD